MFSTVTVSLFPTCMHEEGEWRESWRCDGSKLVNVVNAGLYYDEKDCESNVIRKTTTQACVWHSFLYAFDWCAQWTVDEHCGMLQLLLNSIIRYVNVCREGDKYIEYNM